MPHFVLAVTLCSMLSQCLRAEQAALTVSKVDGTQLNGELVAWGTGELTLRTESEAVTISAPELLRMQWRRNPANEDVEQTFIELVDGSRLPLQAYEAQANQATVTTSLSDQPLTLPTKQIRFVQLSADASWQELVAQELDSDLLVIRNKKSNTLDNLSGVLGDISQDQVEFTWDGTKIPVKRGKVAALAYYHLREPKTPEPVCWLNLQGGGRIPAAQIALADGELKVSTPNGLAFSFPVEALQDADYSHGKLAYLSDLKPVRQQWTPRINLPAAAELIRQHGLPRRDQSFTGSALTLYWPSAKSRANDGELKTYSKGLALRSRTELRYRMPAGMQRFISLAGIDPETANQGNVRLEIYAGRRSIWQGEIVGGAVPTEINVALGDARELRILVDYGENLDFGDRLHLAEARLSQ